MTGREQFTIYGLFDSIGACRYVGFTMNPHTRAQQHALVPRRKGWRFRTLRVTSFRNAGRIERQVTWAYRRRGQCDDNRSCRPIRTRDGKHRRYCCKQCQRVWDDNYTPAICPTCKAAYLPGTNAPIMRRTAWVDSIPGQQPIRVRPKRPWYNQYRNRKTK